MAIRTVIIGLTLMNCALANADEPTTANEPTIKELLKRIEKLEQRIIELEASSQPALGKVTPSPKGIQPSPLTEVYRLYKGKILRAPAPILQQDYRNPSTQIVPIAPRENVPSSWRRHEFNGDYYYTIPLSSTK